MGLGPEGRSNLAHCWETKSARLDDDAQVAIDGMTWRKDPARGGTKRMVAMEGFDHVLNWKLKVGSHPFPGKDGGTCINEVALVAAGFDYKPIRRVEEMPACFSRPICRLAMRLNDDATDEQRQRLLPFVTRLACADTLTVECMRELYIAMRIRNHVTFERGL